MNGQKVVEAFVIDELNHCSVGADIRQEEISRITGQCRLVNVDYLGENVYRSTWDVPINGKRVERKIDVEALDWHEIVNGAYVRRPVWQR